jgi:hypothetical protein
MGRACSNEYRKGHLNEFEIIDFSEIDCDVREFLQYSNEENVLTNAIIRIIEPKPFFPS